MESQHNEDGNDTSSRYLFYLLGVSVLATIVILVRFILE